jgi:hypothetical protein
MPMGRRFDGLGVRVKQAPQGSQTKNEFGNNV